MNVCIIYIQYITSYLRGVRIVHNCSCLRSCKMNFEDIGEKDLVFSKITTKINFMIIRTSSSDATKGVGRKARLRIMTRIDNSFFFEQFKIRQVFF